MKILITGSSGMIGAALSVHLKSLGHEIFSLSRQKSDHSINQFNWVPEAGLIDSEGLEGLDAAVHLAGENLANGRWTEEKKARIRRSRVKGTKFFCEFISKLKHPPKVVVGASAIGYYGDRGDEILDESAKIGEGFLANVCEEWEVALQICGSSGIRTVNLRSGMVLSKDGGSLSKAIVPFMMGAGGTLGDGKQYMSWIEIGDLVRCIEFIIGEESIEGPLNAVAPNPVTNLEFTKTLGAILKRPAMFKMPSFAAHLIFGEMADELLLSSTRVTPVKLLESKFEFRYENLEEALRDILNRPRLNKPVVKKAKNL